MVVKNNPELDFMKKVIGEARDGLKLLVFAVHAVILQSGFVRVDHVSGMACSNLVDDIDMPSSSSMISLRYTLPEILTYGSSHAVSLKIQTLWNFVIVCGSLCNDACSRVHMVYLDKCRFVEPLELMMLANTESNEVFELWKMVKDRLALPLLIDLRDNAELELPPCFMRLPMELKLMIFEYLPDVDLAKVCCTCSELQYLASNDELWKKKFEKEFRKTRPEDPHPMKSFKNLFAHYRAKWIKRTKWRRKKLLRNLGWVDNPPKRLAR